MFNIQSIIYQMLATLSTAYGPKWEAVKVRAEEILADSKERLQTIASGLLSGDIEPAALPDLALEELAVLKSELLEAAVVGESVAQDAINSAVDKFQQLLTDITTKPNDQ
jgi:NurA-like 5'-3' nuclease